MTTELWQQCPDCKSLIERADSNWICPVCECRIDRPVPVRLGLNLLPLQSDISSAEFDLILALRDRDVLKVMGCLSRLMKGWAA